MKTIMNSKMVTKTAIALCVASLAIVVTSSSIVAFSPSAFAEAHGDKCVSVSNDKEFTTRACGDKKSPEFSGDSKKECRETNDKCSSSQTGFGELPNLKDNQHHK